MTLRLFLRMRGVDVAAFAADHVPRVGETVWCKTPRYEGSMIVQRVEHQFDRSVPEKYGNQDVILYCESR